MGITAIENRAGACVAASYEAKAHGVKTGTRVYEAERLCPNIVFRPSRHRLYVCVNQKIAGVIDEIAELKRIRSVDEFQIILGGTTASIDGATALARQLKTAILNKVGSQLRCSIGIGPNHLLAKIAGKIEKPDGLKWLAPENMPDAIAHLKLDDLPGISFGTKRKLYAARIWDVPALYKLDPRHARLIWRSVEGERFIRALQGEDIPLLGTKRNGFGNSKVLAPKYRHPEQAKLVGRWLVEKSAERLRRDGFCAKRFAFSVRFLPEGGWSGHRTMTATQDTREFLTAFEVLWKMMLFKQPAFIGSISIHLGDVVALADRSGELFLPLEPAKQSRNEKLAAVVDRINHKYKSRVVTYGNHQDHSGFFEKG